MMVVEVKSDGNGRLEIKAPFEFKDTCKAIGGAKPVYDGSKFRCWSVPADPMTALDIHKKFNHMAALAFDQPTIGLLMQAHERLQATVHKTATDLPEIPGRTPAWGHQKQAYHFAVEQDSVMLAMGMGTGKSRTIIGLLEGWKCNSVVIAGPRRALPVWPAQFALHADREWHVIVPPQSSTVQNRAAYIAREVSVAMAKGMPYVVCINTEAAWRPAMANVLLAFDWDAGIVDESHRIKAPGGKASKFFGRLRGKCKKRVCATGTVMPHSPLDVYAQYRFLEPAIFGTSFHRFRSNYAIMGGFENRQVVGYKNQDDLNERWGQIAYICGEEVLDLPPYHHVTHPTVLEPKAEKLYRQLDANFIGGVQDGTVTTDNALTKLLRLQQITSGHVKDDDGNVRQVSTAKAVLLEDIMEDFADDEPLVVCCRFQYDLDVVKAICEKQGRRYGEISGRVKETSPEYGLDGPVMRQDIDVVAVQIQAGGVGIDLTRAAHNLMYSVGYSLGDYEQFLKRTHRPGQTRATTYHHLICKGTKDEAVYQALSERKNVVDAMIEQARRA